jgi:Holliday junction resolvase-like predicted endonuclease
MYMTISITVTTMKEPRVQFTSKARYDRSNQCFSVGGIRLKGVKPFLKERFFPEYSLSVASHSKQQTGIDSKKNGVKSSWGGIRRGMTVDRQLSQWTRGEPITGKLHDYTKHFIHVCKQKGWEPIDTQFAVGSPYTKTKLGTAIDLVVRDKKTKKFLAIEVKCGHNDYFKIPCKKANNGKMAKPFEQVDNSALNQAYMQLVTGMCIHDNNREYSKRSYSLKEGKVVQITDNGANVFSTPQWCADFWKHLQTNYLVNK